MQTSAGSNWARNGLAPRRAGADGRGRRPRRRCASNFPVIAQALQLAASQQIRNMASLGGNVLQRTRCTYFRDISYTNCNKRNPGSGCAALEGINRQHAVLGTSDQCIATYPGDFAQALIALDAQVEISGPRRQRATSRSPSCTACRRDAADRDHAGAGRVDHRVQVPAEPFARRSLFLKIRDRESYEFALASAAVALDLDGERGAARRGSRSAASPPFRGARARRKHVSRARRSTSAPRRPPPTRRSRAPSRTSTTHSRSSSASARSSARCVRPPNDI